MRNGLRRGLILVGLLPGLALAIDYRDYMGWATLADRLGPALPDGAGIPVAHVEAPENTGNYAPDTAHTDFAGKTITLKSAPSGASGHATTVGRYFYGLNLSIAPGITQIDAFDANSWLGSGFLRSGSAQPPPVEARRVQNHSWIGSAGGGDWDILRRIDLVAQRDGTVVAAGVNNGAGSPMPALLSSAYNVLAVGLSNATSSYGPTLVEISGRVKPNLVVPVYAGVNKTSWATPVVAASGAVLLEAADEMNVLSGLPLAERQVAKGLLVRTLLMGGCVKDGLSVNGSPAEWRKGFAAPNTDGTVPLDYRFGAGALNIDNSYRILEAGEHNAAPTAAVPATGWDYASIAASGQNRYFLEIPPFSIVRAATVTAHWNRKITTGAGSPLILTPSLANIDLGLFAAAGFTKGAPIDASVSTVDNVEHIFRRRLAPGRYLLEVTANQGWEYAIAWDFQLVPTVPPDFDGDGYVNTTDLGHFQSCSPGPAITPPPGCANADLDGDNDVDQDDFGLFQRCISGSQVVDPDCWE